MKPTILRNSIRKGKKALSGRPGKEQMVSKQKCRQAFEEAYKKGYDIGLIKGFEDGHQLAYEQSV